MQGSHNERKSFWASLNSGCDIPFDLLKLESFQLGAKILVGFVKHAKNLYGAKDNLQVHLTNAVSTCLLSLYYR